MFAQVILFKKAGEFDDPLTYHVPEGMNVEIGQGVKVPLRNRLVFGMVVGLSGKANTEHEIKEIHSFTDLKVESHQVELAKKIADYYQTSLTRSLRLMIPTLVWKGKSERPQTVLYRLKDADAKVRGDKQKAVIDVLREGELSEEKLRQKTGAGLATLRSLTEKEILEKSEKAEFSSPPEKESFPLTPLCHELTEDQRAALSAIAKAKKPLLLHGITGSGKTELYLRMILEAVKAGKQAILLVPEIALTPQMIDYFKACFGHHIALFHSKLSEGQRAREWWRVRMGGARLVVGSRSAIFAPVSDLGVVILDEEHEWTYKQESAPYYQTHHVAEMLSELWSCKVILGSATPWLDSLHKAKTGEYDYFHLPERVNRQELPEVTIVDLAEEFKKKNFSIFSGLLENKIRQRLERREQIILFVNQRGVARAVVCRDCGHTETCPHCEVALKVHRGNQMRNGGDSLLCHYCGFVKDPPLTCPGCSSPHIRHMGVGTQRVEEEVKKCFPQARVLRADSDTTSRKEGFEPIYQAFKKGEADILIGTQMVAKGLDFENVTLIGIVLADIGLHLPDFRSHERLFQLITQVSGRCGRGTEKGEVVLQTYNPEHFAIRRAAKHDYLNFSEQELKFREKLNYPPFSGLIKFTVVGRDEKKLREHIQAEKETLEDIFKVNDLSFKILSAPAMVPKMADRYYYHVLIRSPNPRTIFRHWKPPKYWRVDVDPIHTA